MENPLFLSIVFFIIAIIYSSVGFGGGSSYLAVLVLAGVDVFLLRSTALMCNIIVVSSGTFLFFSKGYLNIKKTLPIVTASVPMAFIGGYWPLRAKVVFIILGIALFTASILMFLKSRISRLENHSLIPNNTTTAAGLGGAIGLLSGIVGIGGGIFLAPVLTIINWDRSKKIAAIASFFILVNSVAGLVGQWMQHSPNIDLLWAWPLLVAVFLGGQIGSRFAVQKFNNDTIRKTTAVLILFASLKILNDHLFSEFF